MVRSHDETTRRDVMEPATAGEPAGEKSPETDVAPQSAIWTGGHTEGATRTGGIRGAPTTGGDLVTGSSEPAGREQEGGRREPAPR